jgi:hypothetical protein
MSNEPKDVQLGDPELTAYRIPAMNSAYEYWDQCGNCGEWFVNIKQDPPCVWCWDCIEEYDRAKWPEVAA